MLYVVLLHFALKRQEQAVLDLCLTTWGQLCFWFYDGTDILERSL